MKLSRLRVYIYLRRLLIFRSLIQVLLTHLLGCYLHFSKVLYRFYWGHKLYRSISPLLDLIDLFLFLLSDLVSFLHLRYWIAIFILSTPHSVYVCLLYDRNLNIHLVFVCWLFLVDNSVTVNGILVNVVLLSYVFCLVLNIVLAINYHAFVMIFDKTGLLNATVRHTTLLTEGKGLYFNVLPVLVVVHIHCIFKLKSKALFSDKF